MARLVSNPGEPFRLAYDDEKREEDKAYAKGFAAGLEAGAEMVEAEVRRLATSRIGIPHSGDDEDALRQFATALRERAREEKEKP